MIKLDLNPNTSEFILDSQNIKLAIFDLVGAGHEPNLEIDGWLPGIDALVFSGSTNYLDEATQYLLSQNNDIIESTFSCTNSTWAEWSIFIVVQLAIVPSVESAILSLNQREPSTFPGTGNSADNAPLVFITSTIGGNFGASVFSDNLASGVSLVLGTADLAPHIIELNADGLGNINAWFDGIVITPIADNRPKTVSQLQIGAISYTDPRFVLEQLNGSLARLIITDVLSSENRTKLRISLSATYGVTL